MAVKIVVGGQIDRDAIAKLVKELGGDKVEVSIKNDIDAAMAVKTKVADYYLGACATGGGGALAMAIALLGMDSCATLSMPGNIRSDGDIRKEVGSGKRAFGFTDQHMNQVVPVIIDELLK
jgi:hypothetical protein